MNGQCPNGYLCLNREIFVVVVLCLFALAWYGYTQHNATNIMSPSDNLSSLESAINEQQRRITDIEERAPMPLPHPVAISTSVYPRHATKMERVTNPLVPPTRTYPEVPVYGLPVNVPTRGYNEEYQQIGALYSQHTNRHGGPRVLPLFGKAIYPGASKWLYYTSTDDYQSVKIPISHNNRKCQGDFGCQELDDGSLVSVTPYPGKFKVSLYDLDKPRYLPHIF
jgi:hypothetical protein